MSAPRLPTVKAKITGADVKDPQRFRNRGKVKNKPVGEPFDYMGGEERMAWALFVNEVPWLGHSHRALLEVACTFRARLIRGEDVGITALSAYQAILSKLAATPVDETKVTFGDESEDEPEDSYFN